MKDNEFIQEAIDNYDLFSPANKKILKVLMEISIDDKVIISAKQLGLLTNFSKPKIYETIAILKREGVIEQFIHGTSRKNGFTIKKNKILDIVKHYELFLKKRKSKEN